MKIRIGFVSNSSSSSFIVAFPHKPKSIQDVKEIMFGKQEWHYTGIYNDNNDIPTSQIAEAVFADITKKATKKEMFESIRDGYFEPYMIPELFPGMHMSDTKGLSYQNEEERKEIDRIWKESEKINDDRARAIADAFTKGHNDNYVVVLSYCDEDGSFQSVLEHSNIFERLDHIKTSYH